MGKTKKQTTDAPKILVLGGGGKWQLEDAGARVVTLNYTDARAVEAIEAGAVHGLLLTGGGDIDPQLYADRKHPQVYGTHPARDDAEWNALVAADAAGIPVLGICRGAQMINVTYGGTLHQHLPDVEGVHRFHQGHDHRVCAAEGSRLAAAWGKGDLATRWVISIHHQAVDRVADGFVATGWGLDGTIEAIEAADKQWILGVQFHPEMAHGDPHMQRIFDRFVAAAAKHAGLSFGLRRHPDRSALQHPANKGYDVKTDATWRQPKPRAQQRLSTFESPVLTSWRCFKCEITFDDRDDHVDHMLYLHQVDLSLGSAR